MKCYQGFKKKKKPHGGQNTSALLAFYEFTFKVIKTGGEFLMAAPPIATDVIGTGSRLGTGTTSVEKGCLCFIPFLLLHIEHFSQQLFVGEK